MNKVKFKSTTMKLISKQLQIFMNILFASLPLAIEACLLRQNSEPSHSILTYHRRDKFVVEGRCFHLIYRTQTYHEAQTTCQENGLVLARIYSTAQLTGIAKRIKNTFGVHSQTRLWVGASDLEQEGRFLWLADNSELKRNSSLWDKGEPQNFYYMHDCVQIDTNARLIDLPCHVRTKFLCMALQDGLISMKVNNMEMSRNQVVHQEKGKSLDIRCHNLNVNRAITLNRLTLTLNDDMLMESKNESLTTFHIPITKCNYSGVYSCQADFQQRTDVITASTSISIDIELCGNGSDIDNSSHNVDKGRPVCTGKNTELSEGTCFRYFAESATFKHAETKCKQDDAVLAAFKSLSQMQNIFKELRDVQNGQFWIGVSNLQHLSSFRWIANNKLLRTDSPMWSNVPIYRRGPNVCLSRSTNLLPTESFCYMKLPYMCMSLYSEVLTVTINDEPKERNAEIFIIKNSNMTIECLAKTTNNSIILSIRFKDHVIITVSNQSRLVYDVDNAHCEDAGRYSCNADFTDSGISVEYFIFIDMDCPATVTLSIDQMVATPSHHIMTSVGSDLSFNCTVNYAKEDFYLEIQKNDKVLTTQYGITTLTFNLSVTGCNDSDVYTCRYYQLHPEMDTKSSHLFMGVHNCPIHILSFGVTEKVRMHNEFYFHETEDDESEVGEISGDEFRDSGPEMSVKLVCNAETYSRPTTLQIKSDFGNVLNSQENTSVIDLYSTHITCKDKGKIVCQITDRFRNETDSKIAYTWVRRCEPSLCRHQNYYKRLHPHLSHNVTATFCFMMDRTLHRINEKQLFHDGRLLETNSTSKHVINIKADRTNPYQYTLDVTLVNVQVEDIGKYFMLMKFNDRTVLTCFITVQNLVQSSSHDLSSPFMSYGLPCVIFLLLVLASVSIYSIVKKTKSALKNASNSGDVAQVMSDGFKYTTVREDEESTVTN